MLRNVEKNNQCLVIGLAFIMFVSRLHVSVSAWETGEGKGVGVRRRIKRWEKENGVGVRRGMRVGYRGERKM